MHFAVPRFGLAERQRSTVRVRECLGYVIKTEIYYEISSKSVDHHRGFYLATSVTDPCNESSRTDQTLPPAPAKTITSVRRAVYHRRTMIERCTVTVYVRFTFEQAVFLYNTILR